MYNELGDFVTSLEKLLSKGKASKKKLNLHQFSEKLTVLAEKADPIRQPPFIFDPTDPATVGRITSCALLVQPRLPLQKIKEEKFYGSGIYCLYYTGENEAYVGLKGTESPIYVGKADPETPAALTPRAQGTKLHSRLTEHLRSIEKAAATLSADDFEYRYLVVKSGMQRAAEEYLINYFKPIWNSEIKICFGIGKHGDSADTRKNQRSPWDVMHPGRKWAADEQLADQKTRQCIIDEIQGHLKKYPPINEVDYKIILTGN